MGIPVLKFREDATSLMQSPAICRNEHSLFLDDYMLSGPCVIFEFSESILYLGDSTDVSPNKLQMNIASFQMGKRSTLVA